MAILQLTTEKENTLCFDFLEEKIREESKKLIESIYADEVRQFLKRMSAVVDEKGNRLLSGTDTTKAAPFRLPAETSK